jgi:hypothetical protein
MTCIKIIGTCQAPNPNESEKALFTHEMREKAEEFNDPLRRMIRNASVVLSSDVAAGISQYTASQREIERIKKDKGILIERESYADAIISQQF